jgi:hypothetical protein
MRCPYGAPGDTLWVREAFCPRYFDDGSPAYRADWNDTAADVVPEPKWKPSIHMPRKAARLFLEVEAIRLERLQDIIEADAQAEGWDLSNIDPLEEYFPEQRKALEWFRDLWDSINAKRGYPWSSNPWVWVVEFEVENGK